MMVMVVVMMVMMVMVMMNRQSLAQMNVNVQCTVIGKTNLPKEWQG